MYTILAFIVFFWLFGGNNAAAGGGGAGGGGPISFPVVPTSPTISIGDLVNYILFSNPGYIITATNPISLTSGHSGSTLDPTGTITYTTPYQKIIGITASSQPVADLSTFYGDLNTVVTQRYGRVALTTALLNNTYDLCEYNKVGGNAVYAPNIYTYLNGGGVNFIMGTGKVIEFQGEGDYIIYLRSTNLTPTTLAIGNNVTITRPANLAKASKIFYVVNGNVTIGNTVFIQGTIISTGNITVGSNFDIEGRLVGNNITINGTQSTFKLPVT